ncbi:unnamed protein product [Withania somnifera]
MASLIKKCIVLFLSILLILSKEVSGLRILEEEKWLKQKTNLIIQSLPRGPVPSSGANPCTNIPGGERRGRCVLARNSKKETIMANQVDTIQTDPYSAYPSNMVRFGTSRSENNNTQKQG